MTCANKDEADKIAAKLLNDKLSACIRQVAVTSEYLWKGKQEHSKETLLIIESTDDNFDQIEAVVHQLHSYETPVLTSYTVDQASAGVRQWIDQELNSKDKQVHIEEAKLFTDGGSRGNPGPSAIAYLICKMDDAVVKKSGEYIGVTTNNQAEYQALKAGLKAARQLRIRTLIVNMDSELVVKQLNGLYKLKNADLKPHYEEVKQLAGQFAKITFQHVPRKLNAAADAEVNRILDERTKD